MKKKAKLTNSVFSDLGFESISARNCPLLALLLALLAVSGLLEPAIVVSLSVSNAGVSFTEE